MATSTDPMSQKPKTQLDSPDDSESDMEINSKPQLPTGYNLPLWRKCLILFVVSWMTLAVTFSSTSLLPATPEIASDFSTTTEILNVINAGVLIAMGFSSFIWSPMTDLVGRRNAYNAAIMVLCACSAGTAVAINLHMFIAMRLLCGLTGTFFMVAGQTIIADIFEPVSQFLNSFLGGLIADDVFRSCAGQLWALWWSVQLVVLQSVIIHHSVLRIPLSALTKPRPMCWWCHCHLRSMAHHLLAPIRHDCARACAFSVICPKHSEEAAVSVCHPAG